MLTMGLEQPVWMAKGRLDRHRPGERGLRTAFVDSFATSARTPKNQHSVASVAVPRDPMNPSPRTYNKCWAYLSQSKCLERRAFSGGGACSPTACLGKMVRRKHTTRPAPLTSAPKGRRTVATGAAARPRQGPRNPWYRADQPTPSPSSPAAPAGAEEPLARGTAHSNTYRSSNSIS